MTRKVYRTAQGKMVDIGALQLRNESVRAVGNMPVNARGDLIDHMNKPIEARTQQVAKSYRRQTAVTDSSVHATKADDRKKPKKAKPAAQPAAAPSPDPVATPAASSPAGRPLTGLAAAIAKARRIKQEELTNPQQVADHQRRTME